MVILASLWPTYPQYWPIDTNPEEFSLSDFVKARWSDRWGLPEACKKNIQGNSGNVYCRACDPPCGCHSNYKIMKYSDITERTGVELEGAGPEDMIVVEEGEFEHSTDDSLLNKKAKSQAILDKYWRMEYEPLRRKLTDLGIPVQFWPSKTQLSRRKDNMRAKEAAAERQVWVHELENAVGDRVYDASLPASDFFTDSDCSIVNGENVANPILLLVCDATWSMYRKKYCMMGINFLGYHVASGQWRMVAVPLIFCFAKGEKACNWKAMFDMFIKYCDRLCGIPNIMGRVKCIFSDQGPGFCSFMENDYPNMTHRLCLQHAKKNVGENAKKIVGAENRTAIVNAVKQYTHLTAFISNPFIFGIIWEEVLRRLVAMQPSQRVFADYIAENILTPDREHKFTAKWKSDVFTGIAGFSTYAQNALESFWSMLEKAWPQVRRRVNFVGACREMKKIVDDWIASEKFANIYPAPNDGFFPNTLTSGTGDMRYADTLADGEELRHRHLTLHRLQLHNQNRPVWYYETGHGDTHATVLPVFSLQDISLREMELYYDMMMTWSNAVLGATRLYIDTQSLFAKRGISACVYFRRWLDDNLPGFTFLPGNALTAQPKRRRARAVRRNIFADPAAAAAPAPVRVMALMDRELAVSEDGGDSD
eukprot:7422878-Karenia_brevis.AAC.1